MWLGLKQMPLSLFGLNKELISELKKVFPCGKQSYLFVFDKTWSK